MAYKKDKELIVEWRSPSNLAIVKYWGKKNIQEPLNPSISFALHNATTTTRVRAIPSTKAGFTFSLDGVHIDAFDNKIEGFLQLATAHLPFIANHNLVIESSNTFPHSSGIASSASGMSALALCLYDLQQMVEGSSTQSVDYQAISNLARLGSGSAARSLYGGWSVWGKTPAVASSHNNYAIQLSDIHPTFLHIANAILLVEPKSKKVSSSQGHNLMHNHPYKRARINQANDNIEKLLCVLKNGNWDAFFEIAENEALSLHALMMSSNPGYTLLHPHSIQIIDKIRKARVEQQLPVGFSMDAGPNIHLLYPQQEAGRVEAFIENKIKHLCYQQQVIFDHVGDGPMEISSIV